MANINITKMSSKGQVVIPQEMRGDLKEGDKLVVIRNDKQIILKKADEFDENLEEDLEFAKRTEEALKRIEAGEYVSIDSEDLLEEMKKW
jgi:AbrB family looped-hinge helix DNA binding protein